MLTMKYKKGQREDTGNAEAGDVEQKLVREPLSKL